MYSVSIPRSIHVKVEFAVNFTGAERIRESIGITGGRRLSVCFGTSLVDKRDALRCLVDLTHCRPGYSQSLAYDSQIRKKKTEEKNPHFLNFIFYYPANRTLPKLRQFFFFFLIVVIVICVMFNVCRASNEVSIHLF